MKPLGIIAFLWLITLPSLGQQLPLPDASEPLLYTYAEPNSTSWGHDESSKIVYFVIPEGSKRDFYIRIYDPECNGYNDRIRDNANTQTRFSVYGEEGCLPPTGDQSANSSISGSLLASSKFNSEAETNGAWVTMGPFTPSMGEEIPGKFGRVIKIIADVRAGDDGNGYRYFLSRSSTENIPVKGAYSSTF